MEQNGELRPDAVSGVRRRNVQVTDGTGSSPSRTGADVPAQTRELLLYERVPLCSAQVRRWNRPSCGSMRQAADPLDLRRKDRNAHPNLTQSILQLSMPVWSRRRREPTVDSAYRFVKLPVLNRSHHGLSL